MTDDELEAARKLRSLQWLCLCGCIPTGEDIYQARVLFWRMVDEIDRLRRIIKPTRAEPTPVELAERARRLEKHGHESPCQDLDGSGACYGCGQWMGKQSDEADKAGDP